MFLEANSNNPVQSFNPVLFLLQLYVLKLLKMQTKYLGRQWRKSNMKTMSAIYTKVRHRLNDDWAYGNGEHLNILW